MYEIEPIHATKRRRERGEAVMAHGHTADAWRCWSARCLVVLTTALGAPGSLSAQMPDSARVERDAATHAATHGADVRLFTGRDLLSATVATAGTVALFPLDQHIARAMQRPSTQANRFLRHVSTDFRLAGNPGVLIAGAGLYAIGRLGRLDRVADVGLHSTEAIVIAEGINFVVKGALGRARPYVVRDSDAYDFAVGRGFRKGRDYQSLPSGHVVAGFAAAAAATSEASRRWPRSAWYVAPVAYGGATLIALSRLYNNEHWASDVVMAAGIGTLTGVTVVRYMHAHPHNRIDRVLLSLSAMPTVDRGVALVWSTP